MLETVILSSLIYYNDFCRKVLPYLKEEYFEENRFKILYRLINEYVNKYNSLPTKAALVIELGHLEKISENDVKEVMVLIKSLGPLSKEDPEKDIPWLTEQTEKFCQEKDLFNAIRTSILIIDNKVKDVSKNAVPEILSKSLGVSFDSRVGHNYIKDAEKQYDFYHNKENHIPFDLDALNKITKGGLKNKTLNIIQAGCVHPDTKIRIKIDDFQGSKVPFIDVIIIGKVKGLLETEKIVHVWSPDGWVQILQFVDKGMCPEYQLFCENGYQVKCNRDHLFKTTMGWLSAHEISLLTDVNKEIHVRTTKGFKKAICSLTGNHIPIVDIEVNHPEHRYWTNGIESHNTGVGKTTFLCHTAAHHYYLGQKVLFITLEMSEEEIRRKIDANLLNVQMDELELLPKDSYLKKIKQIEEKTLGTLIIREYPEASVGAAHFRHLFSELRLKENFVPTVVYVDYLNLCISSRMKMGSNINTYSIMKAVAEELRGLAKEFNVPILSATQLNREGMSSSDPELTDTSDSIGIPFTTDLQLVLITSEELERLGQIMVKQLKNRYNDSNYMKRFILGIDRSRSKFFNVENSQAGIIPDSNEVVKGKDAKLGGKLKKDLFKDLFKDFH